MLKKHCSFERVKGDTLSKNVQFTFLLEYTKQFSENKNLRVSQENKNKYTCEIKLM